MRFGIAGNLEKSAVPDIALELIDRFRSEKVDFVIHDGLAAKISKRIGPKELGKRQILPLEKIPGACEILVSLGGDGTILRMARLVAGQGTPILGVNVGKLGFLAEVSLEDLEVCITELLEGNYLVQERMMLSAVTSKNKKSYSALNDVVVDKYGSSRVVDFETYVDDEYLATFTADGVILSTPTGSTAYALASGGPIIVPTHKSITISPLSPHTLSVRPVIVPDDSVVTLRVARAPHTLHLTADGQDEMILKPPIEITIRKAPFSARLVKRKNTSYFDVLRRKLQWGRDVRIEGERRE